MIDLDLLKSITDADAAEDERWTPADQAIVNVLDALHAISGTDYYSDPSADDIYNAIKSAYTYPPEWDKDA